MDLPPLIAVVVAVEDPIEGITDIHEGGEREETSGDIDGVTEVGVSRVHEPYPNDCIRKPRSG